MKPYIALTRMNLRLALREKVVLFFNYILPLIFFFTFGQIARAGSGGITRIVSMVLTIGILGSGLFGAGIRAVQERETNILRRYKVAPITPLPMLISSMITGLILYIPSVFLLLGLSIGVYHMPVPKQLPSLILFVCIGAVAFRCIGLIIASVVNSANESNLVVQLLWLPMLFLSGTTFPISLFPTWLQIVSQFIPSSYLLAGMQTILVNNETIFDVPQAVGALLLTAVVATLLAVKLFRWEKEQKVPATAKLWLAAIFLPFILLGSYQGYTRQSLDKTKQIDLALRRQRTRLIRNARIFVGDGKVIETGSVLLKNGKIEQVFEGAAPDEKTLNADLVEASGKTLLPGLIDVHIHFGAPGGVYEKQEDFMDKDMAAREMAAYLFSGVVAVKSVGDALDQSLALRTRVNTGLYSGAELFICGPMFTAPGGHGTEYAKMLPPAIRDQLMAQMVRLPKTPDEARQQVKDLKTAGVDGIKAILESGGGGLVYNRFDINLLRAVGAQAHESGLPFVVHTGENRDITDALSTAPAGIEHGSFRDPVSDENLALMVKQGAMYDATLSVVEAFGEIRDGKTDALGRSLVQQAAPAKLLAFTKKTFSGNGMASFRESLKTYPMSLESAMQNLKRAYAAGVTLVTGTDSGNMLVIHGPAIHRELQLYVQAGIPAAVALQAATANAAKLLGVGNRLGMIRKGMDASLLLVDGNPLQDISATERISDVFLKGERLDRADLLDQK